MGKFNNYFCIKDLVSEYGYPYIKGKYYSQEGGRGFFGLSKPLKAESGVGECWVNNDIIKDHFIRMSDYEYLIIQRKEKLEKLNYLETI